MTFEYKGCCIIAMAHGEAMPFSFCKPCWIKNGKPNMNGDENEKKTESV